MNADRMLPQEFLNDVVENGERAQATLYAYATDMRAFMEWVWQKVLPSPVVDWSTITQEDMADFSRYLGEKGYVTTSRIRKCGTVRKFFQYLVDTGRLAANPTDGLELPFS